MFDEKQIEWIQVKNISVLWVKAQRPYKEARAKEIADNLDPDAFGTCVLTLPNGAGIYHCIDGQHRVGAIRMLWGEDQRVPCQIVDVCDPKRAAQIFDTLNSGRQRVTAIDTYRIRLEGEHEVEVAVDAVLKNLGLRIAKDGQRGSLHAVGAITGIHKQHGSAVLSLSLATIQRAFGFNLKTFDGITIRGFGEFFAVHRGHVDTERLVIVVSKTSHEKLMETARAGRDMIGGSLARNFAEALATLYDKGLKSGQRLNRAA